MSQTVRTQHTSTFGQPESLGHACARCSLKSGLGEGSGDDTFNAPGEPGSQAGCVEGAVPSTCAFRRRGVGRLGPGASGNPAARRARSLPGGPLLPLGRAGGKARRAEGERLHRRRGSRRNIPRPGTAPGAAAPLHWPPGPPDGAGRAAPGGRGPPGARQSRRRSGAHPFLPAPGWPAASWTGNPTRPAGPCGRRGPPPRDPEPGLGREPRLPAFAIDLFSPAHLLRPTSLLWGTTRQSLKLAVSGFPRRH